MTTDPAPRPTESVVPDRSESTSIPAATPAWLRYAVVLWVAACVLFHLGCAIRGRSLYRDIHLGTALEYAKGPINLFKPIIVGFNLNGAPTPQELPLWQATAGLLMKCFGPWFGWANLTSLLFLFSSLYPLFRLAERFGGPLRAWWTLLLFVAQPLVFRYAGEGSPDGLALACALWFLYCAVTLPAHNSLLWWCLTVVSGSLAAATKLPFFLAAGLGCFFLMLVHPRPRLSSWLWLGAAALCIGSIFLVWNSYVNRCYNQAEMPFVDLRFSNPDIKFWYFGNWQYRLSPAVWFRGGWRSLNALFGSFALMALFLLGLFRRPRDPLALAWLLGSVLTTLIFFQIVFRHTHYYLMFAPAVALIAALGADQVHSLFCAVGRIRRAGPVIALIALALATVQGLSGIHTILALDRYPAAMAEVIRAHTKASDKLLIHGGGWGGELLFLSERQGLSIWDTKPLENESVYGRLKQAGFTRLVMVSESPLLTAIQHSTSASPTLDRKTYHRALTPVADSWPTVVKTDDILIKELP